MFTDQMKLLCPVCQSEVRTEKLVDLKEVEVTDVEMGGENDIQTDSCYRATHFFCLHCFLSFSVPGDFIGKPMYIPPVPIDYDAIVQELMMTDFRDVTPFPFLEEAGFIYFQGYEDGSDRPVQIRVDTQTFAVFTRTPDEEYTEHNDLEYRPDAAKYRQSMHALARTIKLWFERYEVWQQAAIYVNGQKWTGDHIIYNVNPDEELVYSNPETVTILIDHEQLFNVFCDGHINTLWEEAVEEFCSLLHQRGYYTRKRKEGKVIALFRS